MMRARFCTAVKGSRPKLVAGESSVALQTWGTDKIMVPVGNQKVLAGRPARDHNSNNPPYPV